MRVHHTGPSGDIKQFSDGNINHIACASLRDFDINGATLKPVHSQWVSSAADRMRRTPTDKWTVWIKGKSSRTGAEKANHTIALGRAESVRMEFASKLDSSVPVEFRAWEVGSSQAEGKFPEDAGDRAADVCIEKGKSISPPGVVPNAPVTKTFQIKFFGGGSGGIKVVALETFHFVIRDAKNNSATYRWIDGNVSLGVPLPDWIVKYGGKGAGILLKKLPLKPAMLAWIEKKLAEASAPIGFKRQLPAPLKEFEKNHPTLGKGRLGSGGVSGSNTDPAGAGSWQGGGDAVAFADAKPSDGWHEFTIMCRESTTVYDFSGWAYLISGPALNLGTSYGIGNVTGTGNVFVFGGGYKVAIYSLDTGSTAGLPTVAGGSLGYMYIP